MWSHRPSFSITLQCASRLINVRDRLSGRIRSQPADAPHLAATRHSIPSGNSLLDAVYVEPATHPAGASVLICHGIGEIAPQWFPIQRILAEAGFTSFRAAARAIGLPAFLAPLVPPIWNAEESLPN
jgi:hypothetical protein